MRDAATLAAEVAAGRRSAKDVVDEALRSARERAELGAFWSLDPKRALARAEELDASPRGPGAAGPLSGVPLAVKDNIDVAELSTTGGLRGEFPPVRCSAAVVRLLEEAGAVVIGKTAMDPLGWSTHGQAEGFPPCLNPLDPRLSPGGSSAGSAVAVAAGITPLALGTDTAGSLRIPAAFCGVVALKPMARDLSSEGCLPLAPGFDATGVLGASVRACATAYRALGGRSRSSGLASPVPRPQAPAGVLVDLFEAADPAVARVCERALGRLTAAGIPLEEERLDWSAPGFGLLLAVEFARVWRGAAAEEPERFPGQILAAIERAEAIEPRRYDEVRAEVRARRAALTRRLGRFAAVLSPTVPVPVPKLDEERVEISTRFTRIFNALDWPALSIPCGTDERGRPVGMQLASARDLSGAVGLASLLEVSDPGP